MIHAAAPSSVAGVFTAFASVLTAFGLVVSAVTIYRKQRATERIARGAAAVGEATYHLVDGNLTAAKKREVVAMRGDLHSQEMMAEMVESAGRTVPAEVLADMAHLRSLIATLESEIVEREARDATAITIAEQGVPA